MFLGEYQDFTNCFDVGCAPSREEIRESNAKRPRGHEDGARRGCCERAKEDSYTFVRWWYVVHSPVSIYFEADRRRFDEWTRLWIPRFRCFRGIRSKRQRWCRAMINSSFVANGFFSFFFGLRSITRPTFARIFLLRKFFSLSLTTAMKICEKINLAWKWPKV